MSNAPLPRHLQLNQLALQQAAFLPPLPPPIDRVQFLAATKFRDLLLTPYYATFAKSPNRFSYLPYRALETLFNYLSQHDSQNALSVLIPREASCLIR